MGVKKREFTPESGNVNTYAMLECIPLQVLWLVTFHTNFPALQAFLLHQSKQSSTINL